MKIQIVIPCINLWEKYTKPCIESVEVAMVRAKSHGYDCRLLLVDNASTDDTAAEAGKRVSDIFCHQRNEERWGFQKSVNFGVNDAWERDYDYALVLNNDILLHPEAIWRLAERFNKEAEAPFWNVGMVTGLDVHAETTPFLLSSMNIKEKEECEEAPHPNFSAFMVTREMWETVGEFDELFAPAYFEDNDYHYRMSLAGYDAIVLPTALFFHYGSGTQREASENGQPLISAPLFESVRQRYIDKWGGMPTEERWDTPYDNKALSFDSVKQKRD